MATCHSEFAGEIFQKAGVEHVICIEKKKQVPAIAASYFSKQFYELLFKGQISICEAFKTAKELTKNSNDTIISENAWLFKLLGGHTQKDIKKCEILGPYPTGKIEEIINPTFPLDFAKNDDDYVVRQ